MVHGREDGVKINRVAGKGPARSRVKLRYLCQGTERDQSPTLSPHETQMGPRRRDGWRDKQMSYRKPRRVYPEMGRCFPLTRLWDGRENVLEEFR